MQHSSSRASTSRLPRPLVGVLGAVGVVAIAASLTARADTVVMKNGVSYRTLTPPERDNTLMYLWDGVKKIIVRDSKVERVVSDTSLRSGEKFSLVQPLTVHAGVMPKEVVNVVAEPWDEKGRRRFQYVGGRPTRTVGMEQAINEIGPHLVRFRGVDGFWQGQVPTHAVPRDVLMGLLRKVEQENQDERERVVRFLMGAGWYPEAKVELDRLIADFPESDLSERAAAAREFIVQAEATQRLADLDAMRRAQRHTAAAAVLKSFDDAAISTELQIEVRDIARREEDQRQADLAIKNDLRRAELKLAPAVHAVWKDRLAEIQVALSQAPDAVRDRLAAWRKAKAEGTGSDEAQFALAMSGYVVDQDAAVPDLEQADELWQARGLIREYLTTRDEYAREEIVARLDDLGWPQGPPEAPEYRKLELVERICRLLPPILAEGSGEAAGKVVENVVEEEGSIPTHYLVQLPEDYHPLRSYPAVVVLHSGTGPRAAVEAWSAEATKRGYILIAPQYGTSAEASEYHYTPGEHAAVELALRDAKKRYAVDPDRVFLAGQLIGGNMAWDLGLGHPDLFAGVVVVNGFPAKYVPRSLSQHERLPLLCALGDLAPASSEVIYGNYVKPMILKVWDVTYFELNRRGLEEFPEEIPTFFDWMEPRRRAPHPKAFDAASARTCDDRRHGLVVKGFAEGRTTAAEAAEPLGRNLSPATLKMRTSSISNLVDVTVSGVEKLDVWLSPETADFKRKMEVRVNRKAVFKGQPKLELQPMLEDLRIRGDRGQMY